MCSMDTLNIISAHQLYLTREFNMLLKYLNMCKRANCRHSRVEERLVHDIKKTPTSFDLDKSSSPFQMKRQYLA